jgi:hypothetical protein
MQWLNSVDSGPWAALAQAMRDGLPVPAGFVVTPESPEKQIRAAYDEMKMREHTHFLAVRGPSHALIDIIGPDALIHALRRFWKEDPGAEILVQCMVNGSWCGKASSDQVLASEGLTCLDADVYVNGTSTLYRHPRKVFRGVDGTTRTMRVFGERQALTSDQLESIRNLADRAGHAITWILDDRRVWLLSLQGT